MNRIKLVNPAKKNWTWTETMVASTFCMIYKVSAPVFTVIIAVAAVSWLGLEFRAVENQIWFLFTTHSILLDTRKYWTMFCFLSLTTNMVLIFGYVGQCSSSTAVGSWKAGIVVSICSFYRDQCTCRIKISIKLFGDIWLDRCMETCGSPTHFLC